MKNGYTVTLGQYKGIKTPVLPANATEDELSAFMKMQQEKRGVMKDLDTAAVPGDTVIIDYAGYVGEEQFEGGTAENYALNLGSGTFIPGFEEQLLGASAGEQVSVNVTFPEQYHSDALAGKEAVFYCTVHMVQRRELPALDDEFAKLYGVDTYAELEEVARKTIAQRKMQDNQKQIQNMVLEKLVADAQVQLPEELVEEGMQQMINAFTQQLASQGMRLEDYLQDSGATEEQFREQLRPQAETGAKANAVLTKIAAVENITISNQELEEELSRMAGAYQMDPDKLKKNITEQNKEDIRNSMAMSKALAYVLSVTEAE